MGRGARNNKNDFSRFRFRPARAWALLVLEAEHIHKAFGDRVLIDDLSFTLPRNGIVGVIGPNGVGKSTVQDHRWPETVDVWLVEDRRNRRSAMWIRIAPVLTRIRTCGRPCLTVLTSLEVAGVEVPTRAYVASFGFKGSDQQKLIGVLLSGGET